MFILRYRRDHKWGIRFPLTRIPARGGWTREHAEKARAAMPEPEAFEIVEESE